MCSRQRRINIEVRPSGSEVLSVRFPSEVLDRIEDAADRAGVTISEYVRRRFTDPPRPSQVHLHPPTANPAGQRWLVEVG
jgi:hypothetical protein